MLESIFPKEEEIPASARLSGALHQRRYLLGGELRQWNGPVEEVFSPVYLTRGGEPERFLVGSFPKLSEQEGNAAAEAASRAFDSGRGAWPTMRVAERIAHMEHFVQLIGAKREEVVRLLMWEIGKSLQDSAKEFDRTVKYIKDTIDALKELDRSSSRFIIDSQIIAQIRRAPLGVTLCMGPYNYPLNETFTTLIPALIMGNTILLKPAKLGVLLLEPLLECFQKAFPPGVVNTLYGRTREIVTPILSKGAIDCLAFIGSTKVADILKQQHPRPHRLRCVLGLAAKNPAVILPDADLRLTVEECVTGSLSFNGQRCTALKILFVHESIAPAFLERLSSAVSNLKCAMPWAENAAITPLPEPEKPLELTELVNDAVAKGAAVINPGGAEVNKSFFFPAVVYPVDSRMRLYHEEQFGPVVAVVPFRDCREPVRYIEQSNYGQQVSIFGQDPQTIAELIDPIVNQVCRVNLNSQCQRGPDTFPFTGRKDSAEGTLSVSDALRVFSIRTLVAAKDTPANKAVINDILRHHRSKFLSDDFLL